MGRRKPAETANFRAFSDLGMSPYVPLRQGTLPWGRRARRRGTRQGVALVQHARRARAETTHVGADGAAGRWADDRAARARGRDRRDHRVSCVGRWGSRPICSTAGCSNTRSRWRRTKARAPPSLYDRRNDHVTLDQVERIVLSAGSTVAAIDMKPPVTTISGVSAPLVRDNLLRSIASAITFLASGSPQI
jgi:hypothetical protein